MARIEGWSDREVDRRASALARLLRRAWRAVSRAVSGSLDRQPEGIITAASHVQPIWNQHVESDVAAFIGDVYVDAAEDVLLELAAPEELLVGEDLVQLYLRTATNRLRGVGDRAWERVRNQLLAGQVAGDPLDVIAARISGVGGISDARALTIARTEVHAAAESAAWEQARYVDPDALKIWLATNDERTRPTHRAAEGQAVSMNELFVVGDSKLRFPGDPLGDPGETINCRCTLVFDLAPTPEPAPESEDALVAAGKKWNPTAHPRGKDGRFIKKGAVQNLLAKPKPNILTVLDAVDDLDEKKWKQLTDEQKTYITEAVGKLPDQLTDKAAALTKIDKLHEVEPLESKPAKKPGPSTKKPVAAAPTPSAPAIPAHKGAAPGSPAKVTTALIWGKYEPGTTILDAPDEQVVWNGKKYDHVVGGQTTASWTKKDAYANLKDDSHWQVPGAGETTTSEPTPTPTSTPMPQPVAQITWPDKVEISVPKGPTGQPTGTEWSGPGHNTQAELDAAATKPANFDPNAGVQTGKSAYYVALQSHSYDPNDAAAWNALRTYQSHAADEWNRALRHDIPLEESNLTAQQKAWVKKAQPKLDEMFAQSELPSTVQVWRGMKDPGGALAAKLTKGSIFEDKGFVSTATERSVADMFAGSGGLIFDIEVPKGEQGLTPTKWSGRFLGEWELLLPRGSKFEVLEEPKEVNGYRVAKVRVVTNEHEDIKAPDAPEEPQAPAAPEVQAPAPTPEAPTAPDVAPTATGKAKLLGQLKQGTSLTPAQSVDLALEFTGPDWASLDDAQKTKLVLGIDDAVDADLPNAKAAFKQLNSAIYEAKKSSIASTPDTTPVTPTTESESEVLQTGKSLTNVEAVRYLNITHHPEGTIVATSATGSERLVATDVKARYNREVRNAAGAWVVVQHDVPSTSALHIVRGTAQSPSGELNWTVPQKLLNQALGGPSANPEVAAPPISAPEPPPAPTPTPTDVGFGETEASWPDIVDQDSMGAFTVGQVVAETTDGELTLVKGYNGFTVQQNGLILKIIGGGDIEDGVMTSSWSDKTWISNVEPTQSAATTVPSAPQVTPTPIPAAAPVTEVTATHKKLFKTALKNAKVGYWSKPEAIWEQIQELRIVYPQYTPLQILQALDEQLKTKEPYPYETKMIKWLGTPKGKAAAGDAQLSPGPGAVGQMTTPTVGGWGAAQGDQTSPAGQLPTATDISHVSATEQNDVYQAFKTLPNTYLTSESDSIYAAAKKVAEQHGLNVLQALKIIDKVGADKVSKPNEYFFEKKITNWLKTKEGAASVGPSGSATAIEAGIIGTAGTPNPRIPKLHESFNPNKNLPSRVESDKLEYESLLFDEVTKKWWPQVTARWGTWTSAQQSALRTYTDEHFDQINSYLWGNQSFADSTTLTRIRRIQAGMRPSVEPIRLIRGTDYGIDGKRSIEDLQKMVGQVWRSDGFMSTSAGLRPGYNAGAQVWIEVEAPPGTPMAWVKDISHHPHENEMLLAAGLHYEILDVEQRAVGSYETKTVVRVRVVPQPTGGAQ